MKYQRKKEKQLNSRSRSEKAKAVYYTLDVRITSGRHANTKRCVVDGLTIKKLASDHQDVVQDTQQEGRKKSSRACGASKFIYTDGRNGGYHHDI